MSDDNIVDFNEFSRLRERKDRENKLYDLDQRVASGEMDPVEAIKQLLETLSQSVVMDDEKSFKLIAASYMGELIAGLRDLGFDIEDKPAAVRDLFLVYYGIVGMMCRVRGMDFKTHSIADQTVVIPEGMTEEEMLTRVLNELGVK